MIFKEGLDMTVEERIGELESQFKKLKRELKILGIAVIIFGITTITQAIWIAEIRTLP